MNRTLQEFRVIWNCAFALHYKGMIKYVLWFLMALFVIVPGATWYVTKDFRIASGAIAWPFLALFFCIWIALPRSAIRQNTAVNARLVPHLYKRLIQMIVGTALIGITINALLLSFSYSNFGWCFVFLLFYTIGTGWAQARLSGWPITFIVITHQIIIENLPRDIAGMLTSDTALILWLVAGFSLGGVFIKTTYPRGGDRSWLILKNTQRQITKTKEPLSIDSDASKLTFIPYDRALRAACAKRSEKLAMLTLGPNCHWGALSASFLLVVIGVALMKISLLAFPGSRTSDYFKGFGWCMASAFLIATQLVAQDIAPQFSSKRMEQSLYRLGAYAPSAKALNRKLAWGIVRAKLQGFFLTLIVGLACSIVLGVSYDKMIIECAVCCLTLPFSCLHLRDYSREAMMNTGYARPWKFLGISILAPVTIFLLVAPISLSTWVAFAIACIVSSAVLITYRWRNMVASPAAFPAGRFET